MKAILLGLRGSMRSWGALSLGDDRWTEERPTASAVIGLVGACAGVERSDVNAVARWNRSWSVVTASALRWSTPAAHFEPTLLTDFQTAHNSLKMDGTDNPTAVVSTRGYLGETREAAALVFTDGADPQLFEQAVAGLRNPVYTPFLGRRCNALSEPLTAPDDVVDAPSVSAVLDALIERLRRPGLMEPAIAVDKFEVTCDAGWADTWTQCLREQPGRPVVRLRNGVADRRSAGTMIYSTRTMDIIQFDVASLRGAPGEAA